MSKSQKHRQSLMRRLAARAVPTGGFWAKTQKLQKTVSKGLGFHAMGHSKA